MEWFILLFQPCLSRILKTESEYIDSLYTEGKLASAGLVARGKFDSAVDTQNQAGWLMSAEQPEVCLRQKESYPQPHGVTEKPCAGILAAAFTAAHKVGDPAQQCLQAPLPCLWPQHGLSCPWRHPKEPMGREAAVPVDGGTFTESFLFRLWALGCLFGFLKSCFWNK